MAVLHVSRLHNIFLEKIILPYFLLLCCCLLQMDADGDDATVADGHRGHDEGSSCIAIHFYVSASTARY